MRTISLRVFSRMAGASMVGLGLLIVSGGAVRLSGSGLGCPDWPSCARTSFVGPLSFHKDIEFGNRVLSTVISILIVVTVIAAFRVRPYRRDLVTLALVVVGGIVAQIVVGGLVVLYHLWPPLVMFHFLLSEALVIIGVVLFWRSRRPAGTSVAIVSPKFVMLARVLVVVAELVVAVGTAVSGAGPHGGSQNVKRLPISFRGVTEIHATLAAFLVGLVFATVFASWIGDAPVEVTRRAQLLLGTVVVQALIGYTQYFLKVPAALVVLHLAGATCVLMAAVAFYLGLFARKAFVEALVEAPMGSTQVELESSA